MSGKEDDLERLTPEEANRLHRDCVWDVLNIRMLPTESIDTVRCIECDETFLVVRS